MPHGWKSVYFSIVSRVTVLEGLNADFQDRRTLCSWNLCMTIYFYLCLPWRRQSTLLCCNGIPNANSISSPWSNLLFPVGSSLVLLEFRTPHTGFRFRVVHFLHRLPTKFKELFLSKIGREEKEWNGLKQHRLGFEFSLSIKFFALRNITPFGSSK